ncbi:hypothetical protein AUR04nite_03760 [Glutamicibacter uratoxydans]|uniref:PepSY domain-containing protein n=2 Tax=Glutamicibacter uratoxydans TaxID=43667 RepID=A0A4Y4DLZ1_GLUUR|nr:hypothetical protein AUR04nite_03760 [Glutamicibacter uratoxydans]
MPKPGMKVAGLSIAALLALGLSACGSSDSDAGASASGSSSLTSASAQSSTTSSASAQQDTSAAAFKTAAEKALSQTGAKSVTSIESERGGFEVEVQKEDGTDTDVFVAADGTATVDTESSDDKFDDHVIDLNKLDAIFQAALGAPNAKGGTVDSVSGSDSKGVAYEVSVDLGGGKDTDVNLSVDLAVVADTPENDDDDDPASSAALPSDATALTKAAQAAVAAADAKGVTSIEVGRTGYDVDVQLKDKSSTEVKVDGDNKVTVSKETPDKDDSDPVLELSKLPNVTKAALDAATAAGGKGAAIASISTTNDSGAYYEAQVKFNDGREAEVKLGPDFQMISTEVEND